MHYQGLAAAGLMQTVQFSMGKLSQADSDVFASFHDFQLRSEVKVRVTGSTGRILRIEFTHFLARGMDRYDWNPDKHLTMPNPDFGSSASDAIRPDLDRIKVYHTNAKRIEKDGLAAPYNVDTESWNVSDESIRGPANVNPDKSL
jgi:hypothetical protein